MAGINRYDYPLYGNNDSNMVKPDLRYVDKFAGGEIIPPANQNIQSRINIRSLQENDQDDGCSDDATVKKYVGVGVSLASLITENLLSHPFVVLRRQCQVHNNSHYYHIVPVTLLPVIFHLNQRQGITTLWKGIGSVLIVRGMSLAVEDLISKITPWPKEISWDSSCKSFGQHLLLKCTSLAIITPFYSASLVETVQSDIASEKPGIFDVFKEGMCRLVSWGVPQKGRMLPVWALVVPTVVYGLCKYILGMVVRSMCRKVLHSSHKQQQKIQGALSKDLPASTLQDIEVTSALFGLISADVILYPLETILHRLHLQGTRTIIDNLDSGYEVMPIVTSYEGAADCYEISLRQEGVLGLYKGFGALVMQFMAHVVVIKLTRLALTEVTNLLRSTPKKPRLTITDVSQPPANSQRDVYQPVSSTTTQYTGYQPKGSNYDNYEYRRYE